MITGKRSIEWPSNWTVKETSSRTGQPMLVGTGIRPLFGSMRKIERECLREMCSVNTGSLDETLNKYQPLLSRNVFNTKTIVLC